MEHSMGMSAVFVNSQSTPLFSEAWTPSSAGAYAGTCIFLIFLAATLRLIWAAKVMLEARWHAEARNRRYILIRGQSTEASRIDADLDAKTGSLLTAQGLEQNVKIVQAGKQGTVPFRLSVDLPRAALFMVITGIGYLLMLAVMTMNVGYFTSVLAGTFIGELALGRYAQSEKH